MVLIILLIKTTNQKPWMIMCDGRLSCIIMYRVYLYIIMYRRLGEKRPTKDAYDLQISYKYHGLNTVDYQIKSISHRPLYTHILVDLKGKIIHRQVCIYVTDIGFG